MRVIKGQYTCTSTQLPTVLTKKQKYPYIDLKSRCIMGHAQMVFHAEVKYRQQVEFFQLFFFQKCSKFKFFAIFGLRGYCTPGPYFWRLCAFSQKIKQLWTKHLMDLVRHVPRNSKITVLLQQRPLLWSYCEKCAKINILHVLTHKSITTWVNEIPVQ